MSELIFIAAMFALILILCTISIIVFVRQFKKEKREKQTVKQPKPETMKK